MLLKDILKGIKLLGTTGSLNTMISGLAYDSRKVERGSLFFALSGLNMDGHLFIESALENGARAIVQERTLNPNIDVVQIQVSDCRRALPIAAENFYYHPSHKLMLIGVTGTDGKTSICRLLHSILSRYGSIGLMGTVGNIILGHHQNATRTTPEALEINRNLSLLIQGGAYAAVMEVSSHALTMRRTDRLDFDLAVYSNLSPEHLDFHRDMEDYFKAKASLFSELKPTAKAVLNLDDHYGNKLKEIASCPVIGYSLKDKNAPVFGEIISDDMDGIRLNVYYDNEVIDLHSQLFGIPNAYNIIAAAAAALSANCTIEAIKAGVAEFKGVKGRFEPIDCGKFITIIDYAHTPQAVDSLLKVLRSLAKGKLHIVFGCGGDRDKGKRPLMAEAAEEGADEIYITSDNPRSEPLIKIIEDIVMGLKRPKDATVIPDRREAIITALNSAGEGDIVALAGKGHENYQIIEGVFHHFDDHEIVDEWLAKR
ncbi:MAG: UDP-N-acetylmuramoyl-L-alanyl-D-glutamate--2,6-diaminopimelate ligase [candidate division Zixibacteria bacterium]|nr:UDP-N-acetylmuramoyl-L-alanyl-D-glutamate--2,6-diaminopimelate ligase [Candidatus Tariuqbacter arcticus]